MKGIPSPRVVALVLPLILLSGCGLPGGSLLYSAEKQLSSIVFGEPTHKSAPKTRPGGGGNSAPLPLPPPLYVPDVPAANEVAITTPYRYRPHAVAADCPTAPPGTAAPAAAPGDGGKPPTEGIYRWVAQDVLSDPNNRPLHTVQGFQDRTVSNVKSTPDTTSSISSQPQHHFTFDLSEPDPEAPGGTILTSFVVNTGFSDVNYAAGAGADPNAGVLIHSIKRLDAKGGTVEQFQPTATYNSGGVDAASQTFFAGPVGKGDLLLFQLPVSAGSVNRWDFTSVDPANRWTMELGGQAGGRRQLVDTCGKVIEGWPVTATVTTSKPDPATGQMRTGMVQKWDFVVATQLGCLVVQINRSGDATYGHLAAAEKLASQTIRGS